MDITNIGYLLIMSIWKKLEIYRVWYIHVGFSLLVGLFFSKEKITFSHWRCMNWGIIITFEWRIQITNGFLEVKVTLIFYKSLIESNLENLIYLMIWLCTQWKLVKGLGHHWLQPGVWSVCAQAKMMLTITSIHL
jgi:hypothetical protein